jgi:hypothetical protein
MSVSIKVAIRCRPFTCDDKLGVNLQQEKEEDAVVELINSKYSTNRFAFTWAWWSAYGWKRRLKGDDAPVAEGMKLMGQKPVFDACGQKIKADLLDGNAVVLFAYGLSGSGKTFTVFGPDDPAAPVAWFKHAEPTDMWGIFPNMAYQVFNDKKDGWKISMKYFQNVVGIVRDLMSPVCQENNYKQGMRKDKDGFMDIQWCSAAPLGSWDDLRNTFMTANARKAIAPTQFNHQSTRGHCIMTLEVEKPKDGDENIKQKGRVYVCDLAGTEPAGDIVYAKYETKKYPDGTVDHNFIGAHPDKVKTKELQNQGKKINLSLTEMAQFFMKMAQAIKKKKLKPGKSIPGCNSYFLCKFLKDTMLQARTYLFCAIRPEVKFHPYTFSTLGFAKNASVVKLTPKKATTNASPLEQKLMKELADMKALVEQLKQAGGGGKGGGGAEVAALKAALEAKQAALANALNNQGSTGDSAKANNDLMEQQKEEYGRRGIQLKEFCTPDKPYLINVDEDGFRNNRFIYLLNKDQTIFGPGNDCQPMAFTVVANHCKVTKQGDKLLFEPCNGDGYVNGVKLKKNEKQELKHLDRVAFGNDLHLFLVPGASGDPMSPDDVVSEFRKALQSQQSDSQKAFAAQMAKFEEEKKKFEEQRKQALGGKDGAPSNVNAKMLEQKIMEAKQLVRQELMELVPKLKEMQKLLASLDRSNITCEATMLNTLAAESDGVPIVKVKVVNVSNGETIVLDPYEFTKVYQVLKEQIAFLKGAIESGRDYSLKPQHEPTLALFDHDFQLGTAIFFIEFLIYNFPSEEDDQEQVISNVVSPHQEVGKLEVIWTALPIGHDGDGAFDESQIEEISDEKDLLGKPWNYKIEIKGARDLAESVQNAYCQYKFMGETFTTDQAEDTTGTSSPTFNYTYVHSVEKVDQEFIDFLQKPFHVSVFVKPHLSNPPVNDLNTKNDVIVGTLTGGAVNTKDPMARLKIENNRLKKENQKLKEENASLRKLLSEPSVQAQLKKAKKLDASLNG